MCPCQYFTLVFFKKKNSIVQKKASFLILAILVIFSLADKKHILLEAGNKVYSCFLIDSCSPTLAV